MKDTSRRPWPPASLHSGFSLVELLVAVVVMLMSSIGGTTVFTQAIRQLEQMRGTVQQQAAINSDLAAILELNDRYSCFSGICTVDLAEDPAIVPPPDQDQYAPADPDNRSHSPTFRALCNRGLVDTLITRIESLPPLADDTIQRTVVVDSSSLDQAGQRASIPPHRYRVEWRNADDRLLRQVQLIPTVAAWCP